MKRCLLVIKTFLFIFITSFSFTHSTAWAETMMGNALVEDEVPIATLESADPYEVGLSKAWIAAGETNPVVIIPIEVFRTGYFDLLPLDTPLDLPLSGCSSEVVVKSGREGTLTETGRLAFRLDRYPISEDGETIRIEGLVDYTFDSPVPLSSPEIVFEVNSFSDCPRTLVPLPTDRVGDVYIPQEPIPFPGPTPEPVPMPEPDPEPTPNCADEPPLSHYLPPCPPPDIPEDVPEEPIPNKPSVPDLPEPEPFQNYRVQAGGGCSLGATTSLGVFTSLGYWGILLLPLLGVRKKSSS